MFSLSLKLTKINQNLQWKLIATISGDTETNIDFSQYQEIMVVGKFQDTYPRMLSIRFIVATLDDAIRYVYGDGGSYTSGFIYSAAYISKSKIKITHYGVENTNYISRATSYVYAR